MPLPPFAPGLCGNPSTDRTLKRAEARAPGRGIHAAAMSLPLIAPGLCGHLSTDRPLKRAEARAPANRPIRGLYGRAGVTSVWDSKPVEISQDPFLHMR